MKRDSVIRLINPFHAKLIQINRCNPEPLKRERIAKGLVIGLELLNQVVDELCGNATVRLPRLINRCPGEKLTVSRVPHVDGRKRMTRADFFIQTLQITLILQPCHEILLFVVLSRFNSI